MTTLNNEIVIDAPLEKIWSILASPAMLDKYDPTVQRSDLISPQQTGVGAKRKVSLKDGKNWFEEDHHLRTQQGAYLPAYRLFFPYTWLAAYLFV
ncbi:MAG TPA: SRPBCC family protein [Flavipsychrobacter sp.]|nr:SRPBCC family protein [Flavipsychrobacter sp.]